MSLRRHAAHFVPLTVAVVLCLFWTLTASVPMAFVAAMQQDNAPTTFAAAMKQLASSSTSKSCGCVFCLGKRGGKCCCSGAGSAQEAVAFRALCDGENPQAAMPGSPIPHAILPVIDGGAMIARPASVLSSLLPSVRHSSAGRAPSPLIEPPRFLS